MLSFLSRKRAQWPGRGGSSHSSFARRKEFHAKGTQPKNGVLVPLPPERRNPPFGVLSNDGKNQRLPGTGSEECKHSSRPPPDPRYGGRFPGSRSAHPARAVQLIAPASAPLPLAGQSEKAVRLDEENAPGACSRRGWFGFGGRRNAAPTPSLWIFAGG